MSMRAFRLLAAAALLVAVVGKNSPIDVHDPYIQELGGWAVSEHLKEGRDGGLLFGQVLSGERYYGNNIKGTYYKLVLDAMNPTATVNNYIALVYDQGRGGTRTLKTFVPA